MHGRLVGFGLLAVALLTVATPGALLDAGAESTTWTTAETSEGSIATSGETVVSSIGNENVSISHGDAYLRTLRYPDVNNTFLDPGGWAHSIRHEGKAVGLAHGGVDIEGFRALDEHTLVNREVTEDGDLSVITQASVPEDGTAAVVVTYWLKNLGDTAQDPIVYPFAEPNANGADQENTTFDAENRTIWTRNGAGDGATLTTVPCFGPDGHAIDDVDVLDMIEQDKLNNASNDTGDTWFAFRERVGTLEPNQTAQVDLVLDPSLDEPRAPEGRDLCPGTTSPPVAFLMPQPPGAPEDLVAQPDHGAVHLDWRAPSDGNPVEYYRVYRGVGGCDNARVIDYTSGYQTYHTDLDVDADRTYCYFVTAVNEFGEGPASETARASPLEPVDIAITGISIDKQELRTDYAPGVVNPVGDHEVTVEVSNLGGDARYHFELQVRLCPEDGLASNVFTDDCEIHEYALLEPLDGGQSTTFTATWDSLGEVGDYEACATADTYELEKTLENNHRCETTFSVVGGTGEGGANLPFVR